MLTDYKKARLIQIPLKQDKFLQFNLFMHVYSCTLEKSIAQQARWSCATATSSPSFSDILGF